MVFASTLAAAAPAPQRKLRRCLGAARIQLPSHQVTPEPGHTRGPVSQMLSLQLWRSGWLLCTAHLELNTSGCCFRDWCSLPGQTSPTNSPAGKGRAKRDSLSRWALVCVCDSMQPSSQDFCSKTGFALCLLLEILKQKSVMAWAQSPSPADGSDVCVWRGRNETVWCAENLEISSWGRRKCACVPLPPTEETQVTTWKMWSGSSGSSSFISPWEKPDTSQFSRSRYGAPPGKQVSLGSLTLEMLKIIPVPSKQQPKPFYPCRTGH